MTRERDIERYLVAQVKAAGGEVRKCKWIGRAHAPDRVVFFPGQCVWIELKRPGEVPRLGQLREHARMRKYGQRVEVIDSFAGVDLILPRDGA